MGHSEEAATDWWFANVKRQEGISYVYEKNRRPSSCHGRFSCLIYRKHKFSANKWCQYDVREYDQIDFIEEGASNQQLKTNVQNSKQAYDYALKKALRSTYGIIERCEN